MYTSPAHRVAIYDVRAGAVSRTPIRLLEFESLQDAMDLAEAELAAERHPLAAEVWPDPDRCSLEEYVAAYNVHAEAQEVWGSESGAYRGLLAPAGYWRDFEGISTARQLDDVRFWTTFSDAFKAVHGWRPRYLPKTREEAEQLLEADPD